MSRGSREDETKDVDNASVLWKIRRQKELDCSYCKPNRGENARRKPKPDKSKNKDRTSIRKLYED